MNLRRKKRWSIILVVIAVTQVIILSPTTVSGFSFPTLSKIGSLMRLGNKAMKLSGGVQAVTGTTLGNVPKLEVSALVSP